jgi:uncharacterized protein (TIGR02246 family)
MNFKNTLVVAVVSTATLASFHAIADQNVPQNPPTMQAIPSVPENAGVSQTPPAASTQPMQAVDSAVSMPQKPDANVTVPLPQTPNVTVSHEEAPSSTYTDLSVPSVVPTEISVSPLDRSIIDDLATAYGNNDIEAILSLYGDYEMTFISTTGKVVRSREEMRKHLVELFASAPKMSYKANVDNIREFAQGSGLVNGNVVMFADAQDTTPKTKMIFTMLAKHDGMKWKISHFQGTEVRNEQINHDMEAGKEHESSSIRMMIIALIGAVIGFFIAKLVPNKNKANV